MARKRFSEWKWWEGEGLPLNARTWVNETAKMDTAASGSDWGVTLPRALMLSTKRTSNLCQLFSLSFFLS